ncbi:RNA polymerase sigma factor [Geodermatophilus maliterrae]|uniref:RNA polymerase sigma factor n=1 Tax=Geodermatophilus maliterrae TaxID=3162531 RepID=A0ABV3XJU0_9ACTN
MTTQLCPSTAHAPRECDNATLLARMADGDQSAWRRLIDEYDGLVRSVAASFRLQTADVHDVAQTTWLRLLQNVRAIRDPERLAGWLAVTARRESLAVLRRSSRVRLRSTVDETPDAAADPARDVVDREEARDLWAAVAQLSPRQQCLLVALFRDELDSYDDVAAKCAMPIGSIGPTRARALARLRSRLADHGLGPAGS